MFVISEKLLRFNFKLFRVVLHQQSKMLAKKKQTKNYYYVSRQKGDLGEQHTEVCTLAIGDAQKNKLR